MKACVDVAIALGLGVILGERRAQALALLLNAERHDERVAAEGRRARAGFEIVGHDDAGPARLREMHVTVDAAGQNVAAARVDCLAG